MSLSPESAGAAHAPYVTVIHGRKRHDVALGKTSRDLMGEIAKATSIPAEDQILIIGGKKLTAQDDLDLASLGVKKGKKVLVMSNRRAGQGERSTPLDSREESIPSDELSSAEHRLHLLEQICTSGLSTIESTVAQMKSDVSAIESAVAEINNLPNQHNSTLKGLSTSSLEKKRTDILVVSEKCMNILIKLDSIVEEDKSGGEHGGGHSAAWRMERKRAVDRVQSTLDTIDGVLKIIDNLITLVNYDEDRD